MMDINWLALIVALVASQIIGTVWYMKPVFGKQWMELIGKTDEDLKAGIAKAMGISIVLTVIMFYVVAVDFVQWEVSSLTEGLSGAFWLWLGLSFAPAGIGNAYEGRSWKLLAINQGYILTILLVAGAIMGMWQ